MMRGHDLEDQKPEQSTYITTTFDDASASSTDALPSATAFKSTGPLARLRYYEAFLDRKLGVESQGPERILPENRNPPNQALMALVWASGTMNLSCFTTGFLGWELGLSLKQSVLTTIFGTLLGSMLTVSCESQQLRM